MVLIAGLGITSESSAQGSGTAQTVEVRVYNDAGVSGMMLNEAISTATKVYGKVGVIVAWLDCTSTKERRDKGCSAELAPSTRVLRLAASDGVERLRAQPHELGRAVLREDRSRGTMAYIFPHLAKELAGRVESGPAARLLFGRLLGYTVAHELAHLLGVRHSKSGLMSPVWGRDDLDGILRGSLEFGWLDATIFSGAFLRLLPRPEGRETRSDRSPSIRIVRAGAGAETSNRNAEPVEPEDLLSERLREM